MKHKIDIAGISESRLGPDIPDALLYIDGYSYLRQDRPDARGGGLIVYFAETLQISVQPCLLLMNVNI